MSDSIFKGKHILVVDDSWENLCMIEAILDSAEYKVSLAEDGATALELIKTTPPDLVLSDVMMPKMNGNELTKKIRQQPDLPFIPILLITAQDKADVVEGLDAGADDFIRKPINMEELLARVRSLLRLKHSIDEREHMALLREDFVSRLTHDLRTPLVAEERMLSLLRQQAFGTLTPPMEEALAIMQLNNHNLIQMTNTILEVYRYEAGKKRLTFTCFDLAELIKEVLQQLQPLAQPKAIALNFQGPPEPNCEITASRLEIRRLLTNLVGNSLKFTDSGSIDVKLAKNSDFIEIKVQDTGCGISPEEQANLFERFRQGNHRLSGSGLGLHLVRQIVEAHQGAISVESEVGQGSLFTVQLPSLANLELENVSEARKVMVLLYLDFNRQLNQQESALMEQVVKNSTNALFGIAPGSTKVTLVDSENHLASRAGITFFILDSSENSLQLRKRLLELANKNISQKLKSHDIEFTVEEPTIYVDSPACSEHLQFKSFGEMTYSVKSQ